MFIYKKYMDIYLAFYTEDFHIPVVKFFPQDVDVHAFQHQNLEKSPEKFLIMYKEWITGGIIII